MSEDFEELDKIWWKGRAEFWKNDADFWLESSDYWQKRYLDLIKKNEKKMEETYV